MKRFRHEHFTLPRRGDRVRTISTPTGHRVRVAFPRGPRRKGASKLVSILHPLGENPNGEGAHVHCGSVKVRFVGAGSEEGHRLLENPGVRRSRGVAYVVSGGRRNPPDAPVLIYPRVEEIRAVKPDGQPYFHPFDVGAKEPPFKGAAKDYGLPDASVVETPAGRFGVANGSFLVTTGIWPER